MPEAAAHSYEPYGSDRHGLIWGYLHTRDAPARLVGSEEAVQWLAGPRAADEFIWLHFSLTNSASVRFLRQHGALPATYFEALEVAAGSTRVERDGDALVAAINDGSLDFHREATETSTMYLGVLPGVMVSARVKPLRSLEVLREQVRKGVVFRSPVHLLTRLLRNQADVFDELVAKSAANLNRIEDRVLTSRPGSSRSELTILRRNLVRLQRLLAPEPAALFRLLGKPPEWVGEDDVRDLRQAAEEFATVVSECDALVERAKLVQEELSAIANEQTNRSLFLLTLVTVLVLPFNVVGALFGMNVGGIPFASSSHGFWIIIVVVALVTFAVGRVLLGRFRR